MLCCISIHHNQHVQIRNTGKLIKETTKGRKQQLQNKLLFQQTKFHQNKSVKKYPEQSVIFG